MEYENGEYGENTVDDMMADYDYHINTGELSGIFDDTDIYSYINNDLNDWD